MRVDDPHAGAVLVRGGVSVNEARAALICLHGRGGDAAQLLRFIEGLDLEGITCAAPQAVGSTWYPHPFTEPRERNEPFLSSAHAVVRRTAQELEEHGVGQVFLLGFSQGACLALDYAARRSGGSWGGIFALSGGLIGSESEIETAQADLSGTPVFIGCSEEDPFIPAERVHRSADRLKALGAEVEVRVYPGNDHRIRRDEVEYIKHLLFSEKKK